MYCYPRVVIEYLDGVDAAWRTSADITVKVRRCKMLTGSTEESWARQLGIAIGEAVAKELEGIVSGKK